MYNAHERQLLVIAALIEEGYFRFLSSGYRVTETLRNNIVNVTIYNIYVNDTLHLVENCNLTGGTTTTTTENFFGYFNDTTAVQLEASTDLANTRCVTYTSPQFLLGELGALAGGSDFFIVFHV